MSKSVLEMTADLVLQQIQIGILSPENLYDAIRRIFQSLMTLKSREEAERHVPAADTPQAPSDWRKSITRHFITCLECGANFKQLSGLHLRLHGLNTRTYRAKYGIPQNQPLATRETIAKRRQIVSEVRPWEKSPTYIKGQEAKAGPAKKAGRKKGTRKR